MRLNPEDSESSGGAQAFLTPDPAHPAAAGFEEILESEAHLPAEPPVDTSELPTGEYRAAERHPTGQPDSTGGWYGEAEAPTVAIPGDVDEDATRVIPPRHAEDDLPTQPVKVRHHGQRAGATRPSEPLPQRVDEVDPNATRVTPSAYGPTERGTRPGHAYNAQAPLQPAYTPQKPTYYQPGTPPTPPAARTQRRKNGNGKRGWGCFLRGLVGLLFVAAIAVLCVGSIGVYQYFRIASSLPPAEELRTRSSQFETTRILDRNGNLLYEILDPNAGRRTYDSCYRARVIFGVTDVILVTQAFHLPRALFLCEAFGLHAVGVSADLRPYRRSSQIMWTAREFVATAAAWWDVYISRPLPVLGDAEPIE